MNYSEILNDYLPAEKGDFMRRYEINDSEYIIYSPESGEINCMELSYFKNISKLELSERIGIQINQLKPHPEFSFLQKVSVNQILTYLFDIEKNNVDLSSKLIRKRMVSGNMGYILNNIFPPYSPINFYQYSSLNSDLILPNSNCFLENKNEKNNETVYICFDATSFKELEENMCHAFLLASSSPLLLNFIFPKVKDKKVCLYIQKRDSLNALKYLSFMFSIEEPKSPFLSHILTEEEIFIEIKNIRPNSLVSFIANLNKKIRLHLLEKYNCKEEDFTHEKFFSLRTINSKNYVSFFNTELSSFFFLQEFIKIACFNNFQVKIKDL